MQKELAIDGKTVKFKATALMPRLYRFKFGRDIVRDMTSLKKAFQKANSLPEDASEEERQEAQLSALDLTIFENAAYIMAYLADPSIPGDPDVWLDGFETFSIYEVMPTILELWNLNQQTTSESKKN